MADAEAKYTGAKGYFLSVFDGLWTVLKGMAVTAKYANFLVSLRPLGVERQRLITLQYPDEAPDIQAGFRGRHVYVKERCIACRMCERACPIDCIEMEIEGKGKNAVIHGYRVDYTKCLFCNLCSEACPVDCLWLGEEYDLTQYAREGCVMELADSVEGDLPMPEKAKVAQPPKAVKKAKEGTGAGIGETENRGIGEKPDEDI